MIFFSNDHKKLLQYIPKGVVDYKMKNGSGNGLASSRHQLITWVSGDPGQWRIYVSLGLIDYLLHRIYRCGEKNGTVWAHEGHLHPHSWKWAIPTRQVGSGRGKGWPWFVKSPMISLVDNLGDTQQVSTESSPVCVLFIVVQTLDIIHHNSTIQFCNFDCRIRERQRFGKFVHIFVEWENICMIWMNCTNQ